MKNQLLQEGFPNWNKRDFFKFINMCEIFGRDRVDLYTELMLFDKSIDEIKRFSERFWKDFKSIKNHKKYIERIERGE